MASPSRRDWKTQLTRAAFVYTACMPERRRVRLNRAWLALVVAIAIVAANALYVSATLGFLHGRELVLETDHLRYIAMAEDPDQQLWRGLSMESPFCFRVLAPALASALARTGLSLDAAFFTLTHVCLVLFLFVLFLYLTTFDLDDRYCLLGVALTGLLQGAVRWYSYQYWMTDPLALLLITLAFLLIRTEQTGALFVVSIIAVTARETYAVIFPYYFLRTLRREGLSSAIERTAAIALTPLALALTIRYGIATLPTAGLARLVRFYAEWRVNRLFDNQLYFCTIGSFGVIFPLLLVYPRRMLAYWRQNYDALCVLLVVYASLLVGNNTDRLLVYALPAVLPVALANLRRLVESAALGFAPVAIAALTVQALFWQQTLFGGQRALSVIQPYNGLVTAAMAAFWAGCGALWLLGRSNAAPPPAAASP